jgi:hypothetical protein
MYRLLLRKTETLFCFINLKMLRLRIPGTAQWEISSAHYLKLPNIVVDLDGQSKTSPTVCTAMTQSI